MSGLVVGRILPETFMNKPCIDRTRSKVYQLSKKHDIFPANDVNAPRDIAKFIANIDALYRILQNKVCWEGNRHISEPIRQLGYVYPTELVNTSQVANQLSTIAQHADELF